MQIVLVVISTRGIVLQNLHKALKMMNDEDEPKDQTIHYDAKTQLLYDFCYSPKSRLVVN